MALSNHERVGKGLEILRKGIQPFVERELKAFYGNLWFMDGVEKTLGDRIGAEAQIAGTEE
ncbi:MAG: hypothetical protein GYA39_06575, partial [Methanothrix sp.]|nr:hypothetical protein [Methanothrix sp.]